MIILGLRIGWPHSGRRRRRKVPNALERITSAALRDAAGRSSKVLSQVINKYGEIQVHHDDEIATELRSIRANIYREAAQTVLNSRSQELANRINRIIDRVMGLNSVRGGRQYEERPFEGVTPGGKSGTPNIIRQHRGMQQSLKRGSNPLILLKGLAMLAALSEMTTRQRKKQDLGGMEE